MRHVITGMAVAALIISIGNVLFVHRVACTMVKSNVAVYQETPPTTPAGVNARDSWNHLRERLYC